MGVGIALRLGFRVRVGVRVRERSERTTDTKGREQGYQS